MQVYYPLHMPRNKRKTGSKSKQVYYPYYPDKDYSLAYKILKILSKDGFQSTKSIAESLGDKKPYSQKRVIQTLERLKELRYCTEYSVIALTDEKKTERSEMEKEKIEWLTYEGKTCQCPEKDSRRYFLTKEQLDNGLKIIKENKEESSWVKSKSGTHVIGRAISSVICPICFKAVYLKLDEEYEFKKFNERRWSHLPNGEFAMLQLLKGKQLDNFILECQYNNVFELAGIFLQTQRRELVNRLIESLKPLTDYTPDLSEACEKWRRQMRGFVMKIKFDDNQLQFVKYQNKIRQEMDTEAIVEARRQR